MILTAGMLNFLAFNFKSASGWGNVKHDKHVKLSEAYSGLAQVSPQKFNIFNMFKISLARSRFWISKPKSLTFPLWESHIAPNPGNVKLFALLQQKNLTFPGLGAKTIPTGEMLNVLFQFQNVFLAGEMLNMLKWKVFWVLLGSCFVFAYDETLIKKAVWTKTRHRQFGPITETYFS